MTTSPKIAVIVGSTRPGRVGSDVARWVHRHAVERDGAQYDLVDLAEQKLTLLDEPTVPGAANRNYERDETRSWGRLVDSYDGFVFVTPEYNHGVPAALKNAVDVIYPEWNHKAVAFVAYGADGGVRAVEQWRQIVANVMMTDVRAQVSLSMFTDWADGAFRPQDRREGEVATLFDQLETMAGALQDVRAA
jgi:NAD(P)H-dependent FMN reductase